MDESIDWWKFAMNTVEFINTASQAVDAYHSAVGKNYEIGYDTSSSSVVEVKRDNNWVFHVDKPHKNHHEFDHININQKISGIKDPHLWLPPGGAEASRYAAKACEKSSNYANGTVMATRTLEVANAMMVDYQHDSIRNTVEKTASLTGGYIGASLGASAGADLGERILPGVGEIVGGVIGGFVGATLGATSCQKLAESVCDANELNIDQRKCRRCRCTFIARLYRGESEKDICDKCT